MLQFIVSHFVELWNILSKSILRNLMSPRQAIWNACLDEYANGYFWCKNIKKNHGRITAAVLFLVDLIGFEPTTPALGERCSIPWAMEACCTSVADLRRCNTAYSHSSKLQWNSPPESVSHYPGKFWVKLSQWDLAGNCVPEFRLETRHSFPNDPVPETTSRNRRSNWDALSRSSPMGNCVPLGGRSLMTSYLCGRGFW